MMKHLFGPIDAAVLIYFRFFAGMLLSFEMINSLKLGDLSEYLAPFHFSYFYFTWIRPWPLEAMLVLYGFTILAGFTFALGFKQRLSAIVIFLGHSLLFLMEKSEYNNHIYLYCLIGFWMIWMPEVKSYKLSTPRWFYYLLIFHISVVYFYAGLAKLDYEWLSGHTVKNMLRSDNPEMYIYGGLAFDLLIVPLLIWKKTRLPAFLVSCLFHLINVYNFGLATFPWFSIMMTAMFFGASWPRRLKLFNDFFPETDRRVPKISSRHYVLTGVLGIYCLLHLLIPLRQHLYPGQPSWTEEGHQFSWRMKLRDKTGETFFYVIDKPSKKVKVIYPRQYLTKKQLKNLNGNPDSILQFAHFLKERNPGTAIFASSLISLNGRSKKEMIDPKIDLAREKRKVGLYDWVLSENYLTPSNGGAAVGSR
jgi:vitamin K-dependent gamma-carboxylase